MQSITWQLQNKIRRENWKILKIVPNSFICSKISTLKLEYHIVEVFQDRTYNRSESLAKQRGAYPVIILITYDSLHIDVKTTKISKKGKRILQELKLMEFEEICWKKMLTFKKVMFGVNNVMVGLREKIHY